MTLIQLRYFITTHETGSVSTAAKKNHVSASTISEAIKSLEAEFGVTLFQRTNRGVVPTMEAEVLAQHGREILKLEDDTTKAMREMVENSFSITLGIPTITCDTIWPALSKYIYDRCPGIHVTIITTRDNKELLQMLNENKIDATIMIHPPEPDHDYNVLSLWPCPKLAFVGSEKHPLAKKSTISFSDIVNLPLVRHISDNKGSFLKHKYQEYGTEPRFIEACEQLSTMMGMVSRGVAFSFVNTEIAKKYDGVKTLLIPEQEELYYYLVWGKKKKRDKPLLRFLNVLNGLLLEINTLWPEAK